MPEGRIPSIGDRYTDADGQVFEIVAFDEDEGVLEIHYEESHDTAEVELDRWYVLNCSLMLDIKIIFKTIWRIIRPKGAY